MGSVLLAGLVANPAVSSTITMQLDDGQKALLEAPVESTITVPGTRSVPSSPDVKGASAVLMDAATGQVIYAKKPHVRRQNASTTKMMTAILMIEHVKVDEVITASKNAAQTPFTSLHLKPGEQMSMIDLLTGMLVRSANDAAVAAAEHIAGSVPKFAQEMNSKAREIGCRDTHFVTPNGLYAPNHYSSAYDLCLIARYGLRYSLFYEAVNTRKYTLSSRTINKQDMVVFSKCKFMKNYPGADGVKSGYIKQAGYCYVGSATRNGWRLVSAVLKSNNAGADTAAMMDYGFNNFQPVSVMRGNEKFYKVPVSGGDMSAVAAVSARDLTVPVPRSGGTITTKMIASPVDAPLKKGAKIGVVKTYLDGAEIASVDLKSTQDVGISFARKAWIVTKYSGILALCLMVGSKYGAAFTKDTRRRRRGVASSLRNPNYWR